jgi:hypothetical protein
VLRSNGDVVTLEDLPPQFWTMVPREASGQAASASSVSQALLDRMVNHGECFWSVVHEPFMARDLTRHDVRETVRLGLEQTCGNYRLLVQPFNIQPAEYKRFLNFLRSYNCHVPYHDIKTVSGQPGGDATAARSLAK